MFLMLLGKSYNVKQVSVYFSTTALIYPSRKINLHETAKEYANNDTFQCISLLLYKKAGGGMIFRLPVYL